MSIQAYRVDFEYDERRGASLHIAAKSVAEAEEGATVLLKKTGTLRGLKITEIKEVDESGEPTEAVVYN